MIYAVKRHYEIGLIGLGVMGRNLVLNMSDNGFLVAGYDKDIEKIYALRKEAEHRDLYATLDIREFINSLRRPRIVMILVPAGSPVDSVIDDLLLHLESGDLIIDGGNSYFKDTDVRACKLDAQGIQFLGVGVSGGEKGARYGLSIMPGGSEEAYKRVQPIFESIAAKVNGVPCVTWLGLKSSGHFVKMIHNGIEYGVMQLLSESYDLMKRGFGMNDDEMQKVFAVWNQGDLNGYLMEITSQIFSKQDEKTGNRLIDEILDVAQQKGTGMWASQSALELQVPIPTIDLAVAMRDLSMFTQERNRASRVYNRPVKLSNKDRDTFLKQLNRALYVSILITYAQGLALLTVASDKYKYHIDLASVPLIWRGGCIIRAAILEDICAAFSINPNLSNLLLDLTIASKIMEHQECLRHVVCQAAELGVPAPGLMVSLSYFDAYSSAWLPTNLIQAQRDYFGSHTYERIDSKGTFHTKWEKL